MDHDSFPTMSFLYFLLFNTVSQASDKALLNKSSNFSKWNFVHKISSAKFVRQDKVSHVIQMNYANANFL